MIWYILSVFKIAFIQNQGKHHANSITTLCRFAIVLFGFTLGLVFSVAMVVIACIAIL
mgnify:CR=1